MFKSPCKDLIELRLKKVWKRDEEKDRPNEVIFNITRSYEKDGKPVVDTNFNKEVILTKKDAQTSDIWEKVLTGAEYTAYHVGTDGKKYYYTYHVSEMKVDGYTTEITYKGDRQYSITVTNTKNWFDSLLPETGGMGKALLYTLGVLLLCLVTATEYRKRKAQEVRVAINNKEQKEKETQRMRKVKNSIKKMMALCLAAIMTLAMATTAFAADRIKTGNLTVNVNEGNTLKGQTIKVYKLFDLSVSSTHYAYTVRQDYKNAIANSFMIIEGSNK